MQAIKQLATLRSSLPAKVAASEAPKADATEQNGPATKAESNGRDPEPAAQNNGHGKPAQSPIAGQASGNGSQTNGFTNRLKIYIADTELEPVTD